MPENNVILESLAAPRTRRKRATVRQIGDEMPDARTLLPLLLFSAIAASAHAAPKADPLHAWVIAIDFYARFNQQQPLDGPVSTQYRQRVINPGATKPAAQLVQDFLGRPQNIDAFKAWLGVEFKDAAK